MPVNFNKLLLYIALLLTFFSCNNNGSNNSVSIPDSLISKPYTITETFEGATKGAYTDANVSLTTGSWDFNGATIGDLPSDQKNGDRSARIRDGFIAMNFDLNYVTSITIKHAKYGHDADSYWQLMVSTDGGATYTQIGNDIYESNTTLVTNTFNINTTEKVRFEIKKTGRARINIDDITFQGYGNPGIIPDTTKNIDTAGNSSADQSESRGIIVGADAPPKIGDNSDMLFGNPSGASNSLAMPDNYLIDQGYYTESYNATKGEPNWVSWHLDATNITNISKRQNDFAGFNALPTGWFEVMKATYNGSGFDRGHNCPSADRTSSTNANEATFLMTNMVPQAPENNQHTWAGFENFLRGQVQLGNEVYIIMGSYGTGGTGSKGEANTIGDGRVNVPSNIWKIAIIIPTGDNDLLRVTQNTTAIAVNTPNINSIDPNWRKYIVTIKEIEKATGYKLLSALPSDIRTALEKVNDPGI